MRDLHDSLSHGIHYPGKSRTGSGPDHRHLHQIRVCQEIIPTKHSVLTIPVSFTTKKNWKKCMQEPAGNHLCIYRPGRFPGTGEGRLITGISTGILNFIRSGRNSRAGDHHAPHSFCLRAPLRPSPRIDSSKIVLSYTNIYCRSFAAEMKGMIK